MIIVPSSLITKHHVALQEAMSSYTSSYIAFVTHDTLSQADMGIAKDGEHKDTYTPGMELRGKQTLFAEGLLTLASHCCIVSPFRRCRASLPLSCSLTPFSFLQVPRLAVAGGDGDLQAARGL
jgi:hypothetical protein